MNSYDTEQYKAWEAWTKKHEIPHDAYNGIEDAEAMADVVYEDEFDIPIQDLIDAEVRQFEQRRQEELDKIGA